jgi:hypothetical protein
MTNLLALSLLLSAQLPGAGAPGFHPDEILSPPGGPEVAVLRSVPPEVVSLRVSVPLAESREEAGAGQLLQILAEDRMRPLAARIGARAEVHRTPQALVYEVAGTAADLDFLGWVLREGMRAPDAREMEAARRQLQLELDRRLETPQGVLFLRVRDALSPQTGSVGGVPGALDRMDPGRLNAIWARSHQRENLRIVVAARLPGELVMSTVAGLGIQDGASAPEYPSSPSTGIPRPSPQVIRHWAVDAYHLGLGSEATMLVGARWLAEVLASAGGGFEAGIEIWDLGDTRALVLTGAAYPRERQAMERGIRAIPSDAVVRLTEADVRRLAHEVRTEILLASRTPWGLTELVGQAWDAGHGPEGVEALLLELDRLPFPEVQGFLQTLAASTPLREELHP